MRIGFDAKRLYNNFTGLGNYSRTLVDNLYKYFSNEEYFLYTTKIKTNNLTNPFLDSSKFATTIHNGCFKNLWRTNYIKKDLVKDKIDIFHGLSHEIPLNIQNTNIRSVVSIHDLTYLTFPQMYTAIDRYTYNLKFRNACKYADKIIAISNSTKNDIIKYYNTPEEKIEVIYQTIQPIFYNMQDKDKAKKTIKKYNLPNEYLLYVGSINSRKNLMNVVKALTLLPKDLQIPLVIIGDGGKYKNEVLKYAANNKIIDKLILISNLYDPFELQAFYQEAQMLIYPSFYEGFGLPVTEAILSKTAVITSNTSSLPEAGGNYSFYVDPEKAEEIADGIKLILTDNSFRDNMIEKSFNLAHDTFDIEKLSKQVYNLYQKII